MTKRGLDIFLQTLKKRHFELKCEFQTYLFIVARHNTFLTAVKMRTRKLIILKIMFHAQSKFESNYDSIISKIDCLCKNTI